MKYNIIDEDTASILKENAGEAENMGRLTDEQLEILYRENWFKLFVPKSENGLALSLIDGLMIEEDLAHIDGSLGWTVTLCAGASLFVGYIQSPLIKEIFNKPEVCFGGSGAIGGNAQKVEGGYRVSGKWKYATGMPHLTIVTANCTIEENGSLLLDEKGKPVYRSFFFLKDEVSVVKDWEMMGLKATAGDDFTINNLWVPDDRCFEIYAHKALLADTIYHYPFLQFALLTLTVNMLGMGLNFIETTESIFIKKSEEQKFTKEQYSQIDMQITAAKERISLLKKQFYQTALDSWQQQVENGEIADDLKKEIQRLCFEIATFVKQTAIQLYPYCGVNDTRNGTAINRIFRDIFTASQHSLLVFDRQC